MRDALQEVHKTHEVFGPTCTALGHGEHSQRVLESIVQARVQFRQDACRDRRCCGQEHGCANQPASERWRDVCTRVAGGELEAAAKTDTVPTSPTEVQVLFVGFDDDQPQVHEVVSSTEPEVHITSMK